MLVLGSRCYILRFKGTISFREGNYTQEGKNASLRGDLGVGEERVRQGLAQGSFVGSIN